MNKRLICPLQISTLTIGFMLVMVFFSLIFEPRNPYPLIIGYWISIWMLLTSGLVMYSKERQAEVNEGSKKFVTLEWIYLIVLTLGSAVPLLIGIFLTPTSPDTEFPLYMSGIFSILMLAIVVWIWNKIQNGKINAWGPDA